MKVGLMREIIKKGTLMFLMFISVFMIQNMKADAYVGHSQAEALQWLNSKIGCAIDADGCCGVQCVDLVLAYYDYLGVPRSGGNAVDYTWNSLPSEWQRIQGAVPRPGDVLIYTGGEYGHVAIMGLAGASYHQRFNSVPDVQKVTSVAYNQIANYWGVIRPDFVIPTPTNPQISKSQHWYDLQDTITIYISAQDAIQYDMSMFKDDEYIEGVQIHDLTGAFSVKANKHGIGRYTVCFSCTNSAGTVDSSWLSFSVVGEPGYSEVKTSKEKYSLGDTVSISVSTICAKGQVIGIDKNGVERIITQDTDSIFSIDASQLGVGEYSAYFSVYNGSGVVDTERVFFSIEKCVEVVQPPKTPSLPQIIYNKWIQMNEKWYYYDELGVQSVGWKKIDGVWYYFNSNGVMQTGWINDGGTWYYMYGSGAMATGWVNDGGTWYYMHGSGAMATGWVNDGGTWYYMYGSGAMATGWIIDNDTWYYLDASGAWVA